MNHLHEKRLLSIMSSLKAAGSGLGDQIGSDAQSYPPVRYVTISRQAGAGVRRSRKFLVDSARRYGSIAGERP